MFNKATPRNGGPSGASPAPASPSNGGETGDAAARRVRVAELLATARANDSDEHGRTALQALELVLSLDPANAEASTLRKKISAYYDPFVNSLGMRLVRIEPGEFLMGSPANEDGRSADETQHRVRLTKAFRMAACDVTRRQFAAFAAERGYRTDAEVDVSVDGNRSEDIYIFGESGGAGPSPSWRNPGFEQQDDHPVVQVSWKDAAAFCDWLSKNEGRHYRLPTEAEWEFCCRAGAKTAFPWGDDPDEGKGWANCADLTHAALYKNVAGFNWADGFVYTSPVGSFRANAFGLHDMIGNVWQWCSDGYGDYLPGEVENPVGKQGTSEHVLRGGSWHDEPRNCRCAARDYRTPEHRASTAGFRLALDL